MTITAAITFVDSDTGRNYTVRLVKEGATTDDFSKRFVASPIGWRDGRLAFMFSDVEGEPHEEARHVGNLFNLRRETIGAESWIVSDLDWDTDDLALEAKRLVDEDRITGVSIQPTDGEGFMVCGSPPDGSTLEDIQRMASEFDPETCATEDWIEAWGGLVIGSATLLVNPAFEDAKVVTADGLSLTVTTPPGLTDEITAVTYGRIQFGSLVDSDGKPWITDNEIVYNGNPIVDSVTVTQPSIKFLAQGREAGDAFVEGFLAAADLKRPPAEWFEDPQLDGPTPLTITDDGRVMGHLALWDTCHRGFDNACITPPREATEYAEFHDNARVMLDNGQLIGVGCLTVDVSHADVRASSADAKKHYDHSGTTAAFTKAGQDSFGVWLAGAVAPWATEENIEKLRRLSLSGDWRPKGGSYFLIAAQAVPVPGFPIRARVASGVQVSLTTIGPSNDATDPLEGVSDMALVATALVQTNVKLDELMDWVRAKKEEERQAEYERALSVFDATE